MAYCGDPATQKGTRQPADATGGMFELFEHRPEHSVENKQKDRDKN